MRFDDRHDAGRQLAQRLTFLADADPVVLGLPRGGVAVAFEVARALGAPLDVIVVRKLGVPGDPELAMGALGEGGIRILNDDVIALAGVDQATLDAVERVQRVELDVRVARFRAHRPRMPLVRRTAVIVDDGLATGATAMAACQVAHAQGTARIIMAAPVAAADAVTRVERAADSVICVEVPAWLGGVGAFYADFRQVSDNEVVRLLQQASMAASRRDHP